MHSEPEDILIETYLDGQLSDEERASFEKEVTENPALQAALNKHLLLRGALWETAQERLSAKFREWDAEEGSEEKVVPFRRYWTLAVAAVVLVLVVIGLNQWLKPAPVLFAYATPSETLRRGPNEVADSLAAVFEAGAERFEAKDYANAQKIYVDILTNASPESEVANRALVMLAACETQEGRVNVGEGILSLSRVPFSSSYGVEAKWNLAMLYGLNGEVEKAKQELEIIAAYPNSGKWKQKAQDLLDQLNL